jgi:formate dehydrogenase maturation protein FdhE
MPVSLLHPQRQTGPSAPRVFRHSFRFCPVCGTPSCPDPEACRRDFENAEWLECPDCAGTGYDTTGFRIFCQVCHGAKVLEIVMAGDQEVAE